MDYASAGVDLGNAERAVAAIKGIVASTFTDAVASDLGGFAALYRLPDGHLLAATTDGVGTKTELARAGGSYQGLGADLVAMCLDDLVCVGARPLFFLDYLAVGRNDPALVATLVASMAEALRPAGAALIGGEIAEHPGVMEPDQVDLAGFAVGLLEGAPPVGPAHVAPGDVILGLPSPNLRSNGFSLVRAVYAPLLDRVRTDTATPEERAHYERLVAPSVLYTPDVLPLIGEGLVHALSHSTGGGVVANLGRVIPEGLSAVVDPASWDWPEVFVRLMHDGDVPLEAMRATFNLGIGMCLVAPPAAVGEIEQRLPEVRMVGRVEEGGERARWA
jgi:phosphoribosylformylglycinamidine cyclo-ligase